MNCLIAISLACLLDPSHVEVSADVSYRIAGGVEYWNGTRWTGGHFATLEVSAGGALSRSVDLRYGLRHMSQYDVRDAWGDNRAFVGVTWRPWP